MMGEGLRESGVLLAVFGFLEKVLKDGRNVDWSYGKWLLGGGVVSFFVGVVLELGRTTE